MASRFPPRSRRCDPVAFSPGLEASDGGRSVSGRDSVPPRPLGGVVPSRLSLVPRVPSAGEVPPVAPPRVLGEAVSCALPPRGTRGLVAAVAFGLADALPVGETVAIGDPPAAGDPLGAGDMAAPGLVVAPAPGVVVAPALAAPPVAVPVVVVAPVVVVEPETPTPTAAPGLTP